MSTEGESSEMRSQRGINMSEDDKALIAAAKNPAERRRIQKVIYAKLARERSRKKTATLEDTVEKQRSEIEKLKREKLALADEVKRLQQAVSELAPRSSPRGGGERPVGKRSHGLMLVNMPPVPSLPRNISWKSQDEEGAAGEPMAPPAPVEVSAGAHPAPPPPPSGRVKRRRVNLPMLSTTTPSMPSAPRSAPVLPPGSPSATVPAPHTAPSRVLSMLGINFAQPILASPSMGMSVALSPASLTHTSTMSPSMTVNSAMPPPSPTTKRFSFSLNDVSKGMARSLTSSPSFPISSPLQSPGGCPITGPLPSPTLTPRMAAALAIADGSTASMGSTPPTIDFEASAAVLPADYPAASMPPYYRGVSLDSFKAGGSEAMC